MQKYETGQRDDPINCSCHGHAYGFVTGRGHANFSGYGNVTTNEHGDKTGEGCGSSNGRGYKEKYGRGLGTNLLNQSVYLVTIAVLWLMKLKQ